jgi:hypothetical protein
MKRWELALLAGIVFCFGAAVSGQVRPPASSKSTGARESACSHFTAVCGGVYVSVLPNCSSGPDIYDLDVAAGVRIVAAQPAFAQGPPVDVSILTASGVEVAAGVNSVEYTTTESGVHNIVVSASQAVEYALSVTCSPIPSCTASPTILCLNDDRFAVTAMWRTDSGSGSATAVELTGDTGYFWFFDPANVELVTKVLNGCALTNAYWVFAGGLTNVGVVLTVVDTQTGTPAYYVNSAGPAFQPIQDTKALATCP